jgi:hypothetical protein
VSNLYKKNSSLADIEKCVKGDGGGEGFLGVKGGEGGQRHLSSVTKVVRAALLPDAGGRGALGGCCPGGASCRK